MTDKSSDEVSALLKGVPNTKMVLKIQSPYDKKPREVELVRKQILENQVTYYGVRGDGVGYIYLKGFTDKSAQEVKNALEDLKKNHHIKSLILDLRNNGGGLLESATQIVGMVRPEGKRGGFDKREDQPVGPHLPYAQRTARYGNPDGCPH